jgi:undecaprenyl-diphosphatase
MIELYRELSHWAVGFVNSDWAIFFLALHSFSESIFFPVPPDPLLVAMSIIKPSTAIWLGIITTAASVIGALVGHFIGKKAGRPILLRMFSDSKIRLAESMFERYGIWATLLAAFTPVPYKVFAITAGTVEMDIKRFVVASIIGRGARFISLAVLVMLFGDSVVNLVGSNFEMITVGIVLLIVILVGLWAILERRRNSTEVTGQ